MLTIEHMEIIKWVFCFPGDTVVKNPSANEIDTVQSLDLGRSPREDNSKPTPATHLQKQILAWKIPLTEEPRVTAQGVTKSWS